MAAAEDPRLMNAAVAMIWTMCDRWNRRERVKDLLSESFIREDLRPLVGMPLADREEFAEVESTMWAMNARWPDDPSSFAPVDTSGQRVAITPGTVTIGDDATTIEYLVVLALDARGLACRMVLLEPEQLQTARRLMHEMASVQN